MSDTVAAPPPVPAILSAAGVAAPEAAAAARLQDLSRSHSVTYAELPDGSAYVVKRLSGEGGEEDRSLAPELFVYRLASWHPHLAELLPQPVLLDERNQVVVLRAGSPEDLLPNRCLEPGFPAPGLAAALGRALAVLHRETEGMPLPAPAACGTVHLGDGHLPESLVLGSSAAIGEVAQAVADDPALSASLRHTAAKLRPTCLVHADVKWDNALLPAGPNPRVLLFDWELSGSGDPAWDVASALADTACLDMRLNRTVLPPDPVAWLTPALEALLAAYGRTTGDLADRVAGCWVARTVQLALESAAATEMPDHPAVRDLLDAARRLAARRTAVAAAVDDALAAAA